MTVATTWTLDSYVDYPYIDTNLTGARFTQGIVWNPDAGEWITSWQYGMARMSEDFQFLQMTGSVDLSTMTINTGIPQVLADMGFDHIGDIDYYNGKIYISLDSEAGDYQNGHVAVLNASDLSYTGELYELVGDPTNEHNDVASWVAVDGANGLGYGKEWQNGTTINIYNLDDWSFKGTLEMDQSLKNIQGAKVLDGKLYFSAHDSTKSVYSVDIATGHVEKLFDLPHFAGSYNETEGISVRKLEDGGVEIRVELIVDPDGEDIADEYTRVFRYVINEETTGPVTKFTHTWEVNSDGDTTNADDLSLTLREALAKAGEGDKITFGASLSGHTITLADAALILSKDITIEGDIDGDGKSDITIDGGDLGKVIHVTGGSATLDGLTVLHDADLGSSVGVDEGATLTFTNGATAGDQTTGDDALAGSSSFDAIRGGAGDDIILGLGGNDALYGEAGNDTLVGGAGTDTMVGGTGNDTYLVSDTTDIVTEATNGGTDTIRASVSYSLAANVENLVMTGTADLSATGNALANSITGNAGANSILGGDGNDTISGAAGNDTLQGNAGNDTIDGGTGNDMIYGGAGKDVLTGGAGSDHFIFSAGDLAATRGKADVIADMRGSQDDLIDLHLIDANEGKQGNQRFSFIGSDHFSGHAGELRFEKADGATYVYGDTDGDSKADFVLHLDGANNLKADYFAL
jgi:Ca2+-binding RTX toxin-like protein